MNDLKLFTRAFILQGVERTILTRSLEANRAHLSPAAAELGPPSTGALTPFLEKMPIFLRSSRPHGYFTVVCMCLGFLLGVLALILIYHLRNALTVVHIHRALHQNVADKSEKNPVKSRL